MNTGDDEDEVFAGEEHDPPVTRSAKPNLIFLQRTLHGLGGHNQRVIDSNASQAARKAVGASGAASLRPVLARSVKKGPAAVRRAALTAAQQQKLTLCTSLLTEVALSFGFRLRVHGPDGGLVSPGSSPQSPTAVHSTREPEEGDPDTVPIQQSVQAGVPQRPRQRQGAGQVGSENGAEADADMAHDDAEDKDTSRNLQGATRSVPRSSSPQPLPLEDLTVSLTLAGTNAASATGAGVLRTTAGAVATTTAAPISRGSALLKAARPRIALNTLEGLGSALRRAATGNTSVAVQQTRQRPLVVRATAASLAATQRQGSGSELGDADTDATAATDREQMETADDDEEDAGHEEERVASTPPQPSQGVLAAAVGRASTGKSRILWQGGSTAGGGVTPGPNSRGDLATVAAEEAAAAATTALQRASLGGGLGASAAAGAVARAVSGVARRAGAGAGASNGGRSSLEDTGGGSAGVQGPGTVPGGDARSSTPTSGATAGSTANGAPSSGGKRPAASALNGLFSAAMRDLKKVKQISSGQEEGAAG